MYLQITKSVFCYIFNKVYMKKIPGEDSLLLDLTTLVLSVEGCKVSLKLEVRKINPAFG